MVGKRFLIRGGKLVDSTGVRGGDLLIEEGLIAARENKIRPSGDDVVIDARGLVVSPAFVDLHTHLRQPGHESETILSGSNAGVLGGYGALLAMPNTVPAIDSPEIVKYVQNLAKTAALDVYVTGSITKGRLGETMTEMSKMAELGVRLFTDDGSGVQNSQLMRRALEYAKGIGVTLAQHCEDSDLANGGSINEGATSSILGVRGIPNAAEDVMVARDIELVRLTGARMHFLHISTKRAASMVASAKAEGLPITAEVTPHHLALSDERLNDFNPLFKVNPPLRSEADRLGLWDALFSDVFDAVATDHAPHANSSKEIPLDQASFGMIGLQSALGALLGGLRNRLNLGAESESIPDEMLMHLVGLFTWRPARIAQIDHSHGGPLVTGRPANITIFDPNYRWLLANEDLVSLSKNSPYFDTQLVGKVLYTFVNGDMKVSEGELCL